MVCTQLYNVKKQLFFAEFVILHNVDEFINHVKKQL